MKFNVHKLEMDYLRRDLFYQFKKFYIYFKMQKYFLISLIKQNIFKKLFFGIK